MPPSDLIGAGFAVPVRAPRLLVLANGVPLPGAIEATVTSTGHFAADGFRVRAALTADAAGWAAATAIAVDVRIALAAPGFVSLIEGNVDRVAIDPIGGTLTLEGRDRSADLIEARTQETFANRTASEIATMLAGRHGLAADAQATTTPVGRYWELEHDSSTLNVAGRATTEWDLLTTLALREGFDLWVAGGTLHFRAPATMPPVVLPVAGMASLRLERALTFAGDIVVTVKSWHSRAGSRCVQTARTQRGAATAKTYVFVVPNLTEDAALTYAQRKLAELSAHELTASCELPGELLLTPRMPALLLGTGTLFDTVFRIDEVTRTLHATRGFSQSVRMRTAGPAG